MLRRTMSSKPPAKTRRSPRAKAPGASKRTPAVRSRDTEAKALPEPIKETPVDNQNEMPDPAAVEARAEKTKADAKAAFSKGADMTGSMGTAGLGDAMKKTTEMASGMTDMAKGSMEAMVESSRIAATGAQDFAKDMAEYNRRTMEHVTAAMKEMTQAKSPTELFKLQSDYASKLFDLAIAETSRTTESMMKLAGEVTRPMQNQIAEATAKVRGQ